MNLPSLIYLLCGLASAGCAGLLFRSFQKSKSPFALCASLAFLCFTINNFFVIVDFIWFPDADLAMIRLGSLLVGVAVMMVGLIWGSV